MSLTLGSARLPGTDAVVDIELDGQRIRSVRPAGAEARGGEHLDLAGRWIIPGLWDNHVHFTQWSLAARRLDVAGAASARALAALVGERVRAGATEVTAFGFRDALWADAPTRAILDEVSGDVSVVAVSGDLHSAWLNSAALADHGLADHPTGLLREEAAFAVVRSLENVPVEVSDRGAADAATEASRRGVVGIVDFEMAWNAEAWRRRVGGGLDALRVEFGIYPQHLERAAAEGLRTGEFLDGGDGLVRVGSFKVITDGSLNTRTAYCFDAYPGLGGDERYGLLTVPPDRLVPLLTRAREIGLTAAVHAIGDHANALALDALAAVGIAGSIEHAQLLAEGDLRRFGELGVVASVQPEHAMDDRGVADHFWAGRTGRAFMLRSLLDAGARLALGSDAPVAPLDPWVAMAAAVGRSRDGLPPWHPEQAITASEALDASTRSTIEVGAPADLAVLDADPFAATVDELRVLPVSATLLGGRFTHSTL